MRTTLGRTYLRSKHLYQTCSLSEKQHIGKWEGITLWRLIFDQRSWEHAMRFNLFILASRATSLGTSLGTRRVETTTPLGERVKEHSDWTEFITVSGQDELNSALWLATRAGKIALFCPLGTTRCPAKNTFPKAMYLILYWPSSFSQDGQITASFYYEFMDHDSVLAINTQKTNLANIQPSWPRAWSVTHIHVSLQKKTGLKRERPLKSTYHWGLRRRDPEPLR